MHLVFNSFYTRSMLIYHLYMIYKNVKNVNYTLIKHLK